MRKTTRLQQLFQGGEFFTIPGGGCALHAKIAEMAGYECAYMSGGTAAAFVFGLPDAGLITATEMVENAARMASVTDIPLISDADQGFGNAINVRRTVQDFVRAGVAGIHIEDQTFPKRCGYVKGKEVIPLEEAVGKFRAAVDAKMELDPDFVLIARCDARGALGGSLEDAIARLRAYREAGADVLFAEALTNWEEIRAVRTQVEGPLILTTNSIKPPPTSEELREAGIAASFQPGLMGLPAIDAAWEMAHDFRGRDAQALLDYEQRSRRYQAPYILDLVDFPKVLEWEERYMPSEALDKYAGSIGDYDPRNREGAGAESARGDRRGS